MCVSLLIGVQRRAFYARLDLGSGRVFKGLFEAGLLRAFSILTCAVSLQQVAVPHNSVQSYLRDSQHLRHGITCLINRVKGFSAIRDFKL